MSARTFTQSTRAGASALSTALDADGVALAIASDAPRSKPADTDHPFGAGAAAFLITDSPTVEHLTTASFSDELPGIRYRERGSEEIKGLEITSYERDEVRQCITEAVSGLNSDLDEVSAAAIYQPDARFPSHVVSGISVDREVVSRGTIVDKIGDTGAAGVPLGLIKSFSSVEGSEQTLAVFFGSGGSATAMLFQGSLDGDFDNIPDAEEITYSTYLRKRGYIGTVDVSGGGAHVSLPSWQRTLDQRYFLAAGRCPECHALAFPPEGTCPECYHDAEFSQVELPRTGTVRAVTVIGLGGAPPEFIELQRWNRKYGVVIVELGFDDGRCITLPAQLTGVDPNTVEVGNKVRALIRRIYTQEGIPRYGVKFTPTKT